MENTMSAIAEDNTTLEQDIAFDEPLRRVAYEAGMMLGLEATRDEQEYHRRRLTRQQYWLHGAGTLTGMVVSISSEEPPDDNTSVTVRVLVSPGIGIDGLGREVVMHESYCINLGDWLTAQTETTLREGYNETTQELWLRVTMRYQDCPVAAQPVLARKLNLSTDPVQPSRTADSVLLEMSSELPPETPSEAYKPWAAHPAAGDDLPAELSDDELDMITSATGETARQLSLHARLLHALSASGLSAQSVADELEVSARVLLARVALTGVSDVTDIIVNPHRIRINNLVRPFLVTASQLAYLARQP